MVAPISSSDPSPGLAADASAVINLIASGQPEQILRSLPHQVLVAREVAEEIEGGRQNGHGNAEALERLIAAGHLTIVELSEQGAAIFEVLTVGDGPSTLDDGEAATIAWAATTGNVAVIDEKKATRICEQEYPSLRLWSTVDLFAHSHVTEAVGPKMLANAVFSALTVGRMRVLPRLQPWVVNLIGPERAALCHSLPTSARAACGAK